MSALCGTRTAVMQRTNPGPLESQLVWVRLGSPSRGLYAFPPPSSGPLKGSQVGRLGGRFILLSDFKCSLANPAQDVPFLPPLSSARIH